MREIKFRAWDIDNKEMLFFEFSSLTRPTRGDYGDVPATDFWTEESGVRNARLEFENTEEDVTGYNHDDFNMEYNCHLMQYTGLTDKNGVDIYEGDIVKHDVPGCLPFVVEWNVRRAEFTKFTPKKSTMVLGNIYENPELV